MSIRHDYKSASTGQRRLGVRRYGLLVMTLVLIGLFSGLLASIRGDRTQSPSVAAATPITPAQPLTTPAQSPTTPTQPLAALPPSRAVAVSAAEPGPVKPKYDFYTELPKRHISIQGEIVNPRNAHPASPSRMQPAATPLQKPVKARQNTTNPTVATTGGAKRNAEPTNAKAANAKSTNARSTNTKSANAESTNAKAANAKPTIVKPTNAESTNAKAASAKPASAKSANAESTNAKAANAKSTASAKSTNAKAGNSESATAKATTAKPANARSANTKPDSTTTPTRATRATQPPRPLANNGSKVGQNRVIPWLE